MPLQFEEQEENKPLHIPTVVNEVVTPQEEAPAPATDHKRIKRLLRFMSPFNRVKQMAKPLLQEDTVNTTPPDSIKPIKKSLLRNFKANWREKEVALWYLSHANLTESQKQEASEAVTNLLQTRRRRQISRLFWNLIGIETLTLVMLAIEGTYKTSPLDPIKLTVSWWETVLYSIFSTPLEIMNSMIDPYRLSFFNVAVYLLIVIPFLVCLPITALYTVWDSAKLHKIKGKALDTLGTLEQVSAIPTLAPFTLKGTTDQKSRAKESLLKLFGLLTPEHLGTLPNQTTPLLCPLLYTEDSTLLQETLRALEVVGDARAVPTLKRLSETHADIGVRETAQRLMYLLEEREALLDHKTHLLRASHAPKEAENSLLRPVYHTPEEAPEELLRPAE